MITMDALNQHRDTDHAMMTAIAPFFAARFPEHALRTWAVAPGSAGELIRARGVKPACLRGCCPPEWEHLDIPTRHLIADAPAYAAHLAAYRTTIDEGDDA